MKKAAIVAALLLTPSLVCAAGFAKQSLFLSQESVTEGDTVLIHAVVNNDTAQKFTGQLVFADGTDKIGSVPVSLGAGEADTLSVSWHPLAGSHTVAADLEDNTGTIVEVESATFTISPKPTPAQQTSTITNEPVDSSAGIQQAIAKVSPGTAHVVAPAFNATDAGRVVAAQTIDKGITYAKQQVGVPQKGLSAQAGQVLGAQSQKPLVQGGIGGSAWTIVMTVVLYILSILRYVVANAGIFYPVVAILFLFIMWRLFRRYRRA